MHNFALNPSLQLYCPQQTAAARQVMKGNYALMLDLLLIFVQKHFSINTSKASRSFEGTRKVLICFLAILLKTNGKRSDIFLGVRHRRRWFLHFSPNVRKVDSYVFL